MIDLVAEQTPLGGLERWLHDPSVTEVMVRSSAGKPSCVCTIRDGNCTPPKSL